MDKVTDLNKIVTDPVLLANLKKQGIDKDYVEFFQDYALATKKGQSPFSKHYRDLKSGKHFAVISGLPMCDKDGNKIEVGWVADGKGYTSKNNNFIAHVEGTWVTIIVRNDQPNGRKAGDTLTFNPQLFLDGKEQNCGTPTLLAVDPTNENYTENVLEWDYGICRRRLRIIESRLLGSWLFPEKPKGVVTIKYNQSGAFRLKFGAYGKDEDTEEINFDSFLVLPKFPFTLQDSPETFYPDPHVESTSVDGFCSTNDAGRTWANTRAAAGSYNLDDADGSAQTIVEFDSFNVLNQWYVIARSIFLFDTSALPDTATVTAATLSLYGRAKADPTSDTPTINIYASTPASNTDLVNSDFTQVGSTALCDTAITYAGWNTAGYNDFALNATGLAAISLTGVSKFGAREAKYDVAGTTPTYSSMASTYFAGYYVEKGTTYRPKLVVTYTLPAATSIKWTNLPAKIMAMGL